MAGSFTPAVLLTDLRVESVDLVVDLVVVEGEGEAATGRWHDIVHDTGRVLVDIINARLWPPTDFHGCHALFRTESATQRMLTWHRCSLGKPHSQSTPSPPLSNN